MSETLIAQRESRQFWAITETGYVAETTGYRCDDAHWWCPKLGFTLTFGYHLFDTLALAKKTAIKQQQARIARCREVIEELEATDER